MTPALASLLTEADEAHGSDLRLDLRGRQGIPDDGDLTAARAFENLPCGEGFIAPRHGEGRLFVRSPAGIGLTRGEPAELVVVDGSLADARGPEGVRLPASLRGD